MIRDFILRNGLVIDPYNDVHNQKDIYVGNGYIVDAEGSLNNPLEIDLNGYIITPGLIDYHAHVYPKVTEIGICPDADCIPQGVTTIVDAGSAGVSTIQGFLDNIINPSKIDIFGFINVCSAGMSTMKYHENVSPKYWDEGAIERYLKVYPDKLKGIKLRFSNHIVNDEEGITVLEKAIKLARKLNVSLAVHITDAPITQDKVLALLDKGDIYIHCFQGTGNTILDENRRVHKALYDAQKRGVIIDASNGGNHWSFEVAEVALKEGFLPDIISTDLTVKTLYKDPVFSLPYIMSKYLALGVSLERIIACCTVNPAKAMGLAVEKGNLSIGSKADITVLRLENKFVDFSDTKGVHRQGTQLLIPKMTIINGELCYRSLDTL